MRYVVYFYSDKQIVQVDEEDVILGEYHSFTRDDWSTMDCQMEPKVTVLYEDKPYQACILQVNVSSSYVHDKNFLFCFIGNG